MERNLKNAARVLLAMQRMSWEQGVAAQAFFESGEASTGLLLVKEAIRRGDGNGLLGITNPAMDAVDCGANGLPAYYAYLHTKDRRYWEALDRLADWLEFSAPRAVSGQLYHNPGSSRAMIDGIYHIVPPLVAAGRTAFAMNQVSLFHQRHYDARTGLYRQFWDDAANSFCRRGLWGGGQGWMAGALALACLYLPPECRKDRESLAELLNRLLAAMKNYLRADGRFHDVLDDPSTFPEVTASLMMCYAVYIGIRAAVVPLDEKTDADRVLALLERYVDEEGFVNSACASPGFDRPGNSAEAQAFYLLCHSAKRAMENNNPIMR